MPEFPVFKQLDFMDCGPTCLQMVAKHYGKSYTLQFLRSISFISKSGVSMLGISDVAESIGFRTRGYRLTWEQLRDEVPLPCIVHWNQRHFVVVYRIKKRRAGGWGQGKRSHAGRARHASHASHASYVSDERGRSSPESEATRDHASQKPDLHDLHDLHDLQDRSIVYLMIRAE